MTTTERIKNLIHESGKTDYCIKKETGLGNSVLSDLKAGRAENPSAKTIRLLARYFNVSADYLLCLIDEPKPLESREVGEISDSLPAEIGEISELVKEQRFIDTAKIYNELPDSFRERVYGLVMGIAVGIGLNVDKILGR